MWATSGSDTFGPGHKKATSAESLPEVAHTRLLSGYSISVGEMGKYCCECCTYFLPEDERNAIAIDKEIQHILAEQRKKEQR
ncbi:hypothetical protein F2P79_017035 [Pimephales promelas]|nr:hypothetical protein F2P79_017035 [Pimephales promelas]